MKPVNTEPLHHPCLLESGQRRVEPCLGREVGCHRREGGGDLRKEMVGGAGCGDEEFEYGWVGGYGGVVRDGCFRVGAGEDDGVRAAEVDEAGFAGFDVEGPFVGGGEGFFGAEAVPLGSAVGVGGRWGWWEGQDGDVA